MQRKVSSRKKTRANSVSASAPRRAARSSARIRASRRESAVSEVKAGNAAKKRALKAPLKTQIKAQLKTPSKTSSSKRAIAGYNPVGLVKASAKMKNKNVYAGTGISKADDPYKAGKEAVEMAIQKAGKAPNFGVVFCSGGKYGKDDATIAKLVKGAHDAFMSANPKCKWIGCTTAGEISNYGVTEDSCIALAVSSEYIVTGVGVEAKVSKNPEASGQKVAKASISDLKLDKYFGSYLQFLASKKKDVEFMMNHKQYTVIALAPGSTMNYIGCESKLLKGLTTVFGSHIPILGGSAADGPTFKQTYQFANGNLYKDALVVLTTVIYLETGYGTRHAYEPSGKVVFVNRSKDKLVMELNNKDPLEAYGELVNMAPKDLQGPKPAYVGVQFPFGIVDINGKYWIRSPQAGLKEGMLFFADIPQSSTLSLMKADAKKVISCAKQSITDAVDGRKDTSFALIFDCVGRKTFLKDKVCQEIEGVISVLKETPFIGFYTFGEFGFDSRNPPNLVNGTVVSFSVTDKVITDK